MLAARHQQGAKLQFLYQLGTLADQLGFVGAATDDQFAVGITYQF